MFRPARVPRRGDRRALTAGVLLAVSSGGAALAEGAGPPIRIAGPDEPVIRAGAFNRCIEQRGGVTLVDTPDAPPALLVHPDGSRLLIAAMSQNVPFVAPPGGDWARAGCISALHSQMDPDPAHFRYQTWLAALWSRDGRRVFGLGHDEWHGWEAWPMCRARAVSGVDTYGLCLRISLSGYVSDDGGAHFAPIAGQVPLAAPAAMPTPFNSLTFTRARIGDPSNLATDPHDGYTYFLATADGEGQAQRGTCAFRTRDPFAGPWFTWDGHGFGRQVSGSDGQRGCVPVRPWGIATQALSFNTAIDAFMAIGQADDHHLVALSSRDLVHWSAPVPLRTAIEPGWFKPGTADPIPAQYYALNDPADPHANMGQSGAHPYLYYVSYPVSGGHVNWRGREVWRVPLSVGA